MSCVRRHSMDPDILGALAELAWPILAAVVLFALLPTIIRVARSRAVSIKYGNMEISVQDASDQIRRQIDDLQDQVRALQGHPGRQTRATTEDLEIIAEPPTTEQAAPLTILWVDDHPKNNAHEIAKLQSEGWEITTVGSTGDALDFLGNRAGPPTLIISDMGRWEGLIQRKRAGIDLIKAVRNSGLEIPIYIYASSKAVQSFKREVRQFSNADITDSPIELFDLVRNATAAASRTS